MKLKLYIVISLLLTACIPVSAQILIPNTTAVTQNFDGMGSSATAALPTGFKVNLSNPNYTTGAVSATTQTAGTTGAGALTTTSTFGIYNYGNGVNASTTDRSLGFLSTGSSTGARYIIAEIKNTGTDVISDLAISFDYEKYRAGTNAFAMAFFHGATSTAVTTAATAGDQAYAADGALAVLNPPTTINKSFSITGLSITPNSTYYLCWRYSASTYTNAQGLGIDNLSLTATFTPACTTPTLQASSLIVSNPTGTSADFSWTNATGTNGTIVVIRPTAAANVLPVSGTNYIGDTNYSTAPQTGTNNKVVYKGNGTSVSVTGLTAGTQYTATIYSFNEPASCYYTTAPESLNFFTLTAEPAASPAVFSCVTISSSQINLTFTALPASVKGYLITYGVGAIPTGFPADGTQYAPGTIIGDATVVAEITTTGATTLSVTGLNGGSNYFFSIFPFNGTIGNGVTYNYRTTAIRSTSGCSTTTAPEINVKGVIGANPSILNGDMTPRATDNTQFATTAVGGSQAKVFRIENLGNASLVVTGIVMAGTNPGDFAVSGVVFPLTVSAGSFANFTVTFSPTAGGLRTAIVQISNNDSDESLYQYAVEGTGNAAEIDVLGGGISIPTGSSIVSAANQTQFGDVNYLSGSAVHTFTISNLGTLGLTISTPVISGPNASDFTITTFPSSTVAAGAATTVVITFDPATAGVKNATVTIGNTDPNENPYTFAIQGTGTNYIFCVLGAPETIASQNFEITAPTPALTYTVTQDSGMAVPQVTGGNLLGDNRTTTTPAFINARSFQAKGYSSSSSDPELSATINFDTYDVSAYKEVSLNFKLGAYSSTVGTSVGLDTDDEVDVYISTNGGTSWSHEMNISGYSNAIWDINTGTKSATINADGDNIASQFSPPSTINTVDEGPRDITINNIPNVTQLKIRIVFSVNRTDEIWVIDDVKLSGRKPATTTWGGSSWTNGAPNNTTKAIFAGSYSAGLNIEACSCEIKSPFVVNVAGGKYIEIQNDITNNGTINIANNGSLIQVNDYAVNSGVSNVYRNTQPYDPYDYTYWSSPIAAANIGTTFTGMDVGHSYSFTTANYSDLNNDNSDDAAPFAWVFEGATGTMIPGRGYIVRGSATGPFPVTSTAQFSGVLNNGEIPVAVALSANNADNNDDYNLLGNPYPSAISGDGFIDLNTNTAGALYFWTHIDNLSVTYATTGVAGYTPDDYAVYTKMGGTGTRGPIHAPGHPTSGSPNIPSGFIASGQGFFTDYNGPATGTVLFKNSLRSKGYGNGDFYKMGENSQKDRVWLNMQSTGGIFSQQLIGYTANATLGPDRGYDALLNDGGNFINFYSLIGNEAYKIQGRPSFDADDVVPLGYFSALDSQFEISIDKSEGVLNEIEHVYLEDLENNIIHDLKQSPYIFNTLKGKFESRFKLRYKTGSLSNEQFDHAADVGIVSDNKQIKVRSSGDMIQEITVYDILGRTIFSKDNLSQYEYAISDVVKSQQALIVKVRLKNGSQISKKILF